MSKHGTLTTAHQLQALLGAGRLGDLTDGQLLAKFLAVAENPELAETAFAALVERHGPMVFRVCHSVTRDAHDAEDAFQATFLVLVRKARRLNVRVTLAPWLHNVARKVSLHARADRVRRCRNEKSLASNPCVRPTALAHDPTALEREESDKLLHSEIARLPRRYRDCLVLCDLEGCTYEQAAQTLELPLGTVQSRLARARKRLHDRFTRIGLLPWQPGRTGASLGIGLPSSKLVPPMSLFRTTTAECLQSAAGESAGLKFVSGSIATLVQSASRSTVGSRAMFAGSALFPVVLLSGLAVYSQGPSLPQSASNQVRVTPSPQSRLSAQSHQLSLIPAPRDLRAASGRGKILMYELTADGKRVWTKQEQPLGSGGKPASLQETRRQLSWVVITGVVDHKTIADNLARAGLGAMASDTSPQFDFCRF